MKVLFIVYRRPELSHEQCLAEWGGDRHTIIVQQIPGLQRWVQNHVDEPSSKNVPDGVGELWFDGPESMQSPEMDAAVEDAGRFLDMSRTYAVTVEEKSIRT